MDGEFGIIFNRGFLGLSFRAQGSPAAWGWFYIQGEFVARFVDFQVDSSLRAE
jgi:hypothetical protein